VAMWNLHEFVEQYVALAGDFGKPAELSQFALPDEEIVAVFGSFEDDYHISRFLHFTKLPGKSYLIGGAEVTHLSIDRAIESIL